MPQTRSNLRSENVHNGDKEETSQDNSNELLRTNIVASPAKKRRAGGRADTPRKRCRGNPGELCRLNLDVLFILATYIQPLDLLNLARTCKSLRRLLMDRFSAFVWKAVLRNVKGLPGCPVDMSEPAYTNLVFSPRCHGCGKYSSATLWRIRRRYCPSCRIERLRPYAYWPKVISRIICIAAEYVSVDKERVSCHDKDQVDLLMQEYECSPDKEQFLSNKRKHFRAIHEHAAKCEEWKREMASGRKDELSVCRLERHEFILERLKELGYGPEISYFRPKHFQESQKAPPKPLTEEEWVQMLPKWLETMNHYRRLRLDASVHTPRRRLLASQYDNYVRQRSQDTPVFDLLPHVTDLARFPPFRNVIKAPEGTQIGENPFASAFAQLPELVEEWKKQVEAELVEQVMIPLHLSSQDVSPRRLVASSGVTNAVNLHLACALFQAAGHRLLPYPEAFLISTPHQGCADEDAARVTESIRGRFGIEFLEEAPYIVHACGLDPSMATPDEMDHYNARLRCLVCQRRVTLVMDWRDAMVHACVYHRSPILEPLAKSPRWKLVTDEHIDMYGNVKEFTEKKSPPCFWRCLLCQPRVGDASTNDRIIVHLKIRHGLEATDVKQGVHHAPLA